MQRNIIAERDARPAAGGTDDDAPPPYVPGHALLEGKTVVVTAVAGAGIGMAAAKRCLEEGARVVISDTHERRLGETLDALRPLGEVSAPCAATSRSRPRCRR